MVVNNCLGNSAWGWTRNFVTAVSKYFQERSRAGRPSSGNLCQVVWERLPLACNTEWLSPLFPMLAVMPMRSGETGARRDKFGPQNKRGAKSK